MRRRDLLVLGTAAAVGWPLTGWAQQAQPVRGPGGRPWLIGALLGPIKPQGDRESLEPFIAGMAKLGYVQSRDYTIGVRYAEGDNTRLPALARELVDLRPDIIFTGSQVIEAAAATSTIPILSGNITPEHIEPVIGKNLARPTGNVTGIAVDLARLTGKHCDLALELVPGATRVGVLVYPLNAANAATVREQVVAAANARKFTPILIDVPQPQEVLAAFHTLAGAGVDAVVVGPGNAFSSNRANTAAAAAAVGLPATYNEQGYVEAGGLISYGYDRKGNYERLAGFAVQIFAGGKPSDLPVEQTSNYVMAINLKTAKALGLAIPPTVLFRADIVIDA
jgi:putative ABC transport system substrate-binding protein